MKKLSILCVALMITVSTHAQDNIPSTIEVLSTIYFKPGFTYSVQVIISRDFMYDYYSQTKSLASVQEEYFQQITSLGMDIEAFKEDKIGYLTLGYTKEGTMFTFSTNSSKTLEKVLSVATPGCRVTRSMVSASVFPEKVRELAAAVIEKTRKKATMIAETQNRKLGKILKIVDHEPDRVTNLSMLPDFYEEGQYPYSVTVTFELL